MSESKKFAAEFERRTRALIDMVAQNDELLQRVTRLEVEQVAAQRQEALLAGMVAAQAEIITYKDAEIARLRSLMANMVRIDEMQPLSLRVA